MTDKPTLRQIYDIAISTLPDEQAFKAKMAECGVPLATVSRISSDFVKYIFSGGDVCWIGKEIFSLSKVYQIGCGLFVNQIGINRNGILRTYFEIKLPHTISAELDIFDLGVTHTMLGALIDQMKAEKRSQETNFAGITESFPDVPLTDASDALTDEFQKPDFNWPRL